MFDLETIDIYIPNTEVMRHYLESLNYVLMPISIRNHKEPIKYYMLQWMGRTVWTT